MWPDRVAPDRLSGARPPCVLACLRAPWRSRARRGRFTCPSPPQHCRSWPRPTAISTMPVTMKSSIRYEAFIQCLVWVVLRRALRRLRSGIPTFLVPIHASEQQLQCCPFTITIVIALDPPRPRRVELYCEPLSLHLILLAQGELSCTASCVGVFCDTCICPVSPPQALYCVGRILREPCSVGQHGPT